MVRTYADAGVDIDASDRATAALVAQLGGTTREGDGMPIAMENGFAGLVRLGEGALAVCTDGVGTKLLLARELDSLDTLGIDCVAMNVNDLICVGAEPLTFVDYVALEEPDEVLMAQLGTGLAEGCRLANCTLSGGETAVVPELVRDFDLAGTAVGWVARGGIIDGSRVTDGDALIGLASSGPHSNGYTLIRRLFNNDPVLGSQLVAPTR
ncbi:MAG: AIR synthase related protein, partial [Candidatus Thermoplasmatota archaeon]|nr:AIR synthase related protein [Candidatus Thermoplasmatota archaeon]